MCSLGCKKQQQCIKRPNPQRRVAYDGDDCRKDG
jgi:hypothetical protein